MYGFCRCLFLHSTIVTGGRYNVVNEAAGDGPVVPYREPFPILHVEKCPVVVYS